MEVRGFRIVAGTVIGVLLSVSLSACEFQFESQITPLVLATAPPQYLPGAVGASTSEQPTLPAATVTPSRGFGVFNSSQAIELCARLEMVGNERVGSCLAPAGETYYVWIEPDNVLEVARNDEYLDEFREAATKRVEALGVLADEWYGGWWDLPVLGISTFGLTLCVAGAAPGPQQIPLLAGCGLDIAAWLGTGIKLANDANNTANAVIEWYDRSMDAGYNYCRMEGGSDADCR